MEVSIGVISKNANELRTLENILLFFIKFIDILRGYIIFKSIDGLGIKK